MTQDFQGTPFRPLTPDELSQMQGVRQALLQQPSAQLQETQAAAGAQGASAGLSSQETRNAELQTQPLEIKAQQAKASQNLREDLQNKMTLPHAISKYTSLGMNPNDIFSQYLSESPWGTPNENPEDLQKMGVSADALGKIGTPGSFMDRYNTKNAIAGLRGLEDTWNKTSALAHLPFLGNTDASAKIYNSQKQFVGEHLSSLVPGASNSEQSAQGFLNSLPNIGDLNASGAASGQFTKVEQSLLQSKGYSYKDLGITPRADSQPQNNNQPSLSGFAQNVATSGKDLLNHLLNLPLEQGKKLAADIKSGNAQQAFNDSNPSMLLASAIKGYGQNLYKDAGSPMQGGDIMGRILGNAYKNPVGVAADALPFLSALKGGSIADGAEAGATEGGGAAEAETAATPKMPGKLQQILNPQGTKDVGSQIRDTAVNVAQKNKAVIPGNNIINSMSEWEKTAKAANPGQSSKVADVMDGLLENYADKNITPNDAVKIYHEIDSGFSNRGIQKETVQASSDMALRDALSKELEKVAPGWTKGTGAIAKGFKAEKSPLGQIKKNLPSNAVKAGLNGVANLAGLGLLKDIIGL